MKTTTTSAKIDLLKAKQWIPSRQMCRFYFDRAFVQVNVSNGAAYYKIVGFDNEIENIDEVKSQISYFANVECNRIFASKF